MPLFLIVILLFTASNSSYAYEFELSGFVAAEGRIFPNSPRFPQQHGTNGSFAVQPELYLEWDGGKQSLLFVPFARVDQGDSRRTHADVRELTYVRAADWWEMRIGLRKVFWGVAESNHLVDVINQTDLVENIDTEDKLGQPMINFALIQDWGTVDLFILPGFRERTFAGKSGRLRPAFRVDPSNEDYDSAAKNKHVDYALRYSHYFGDFDVGLYHFWGTTREPRFIPKRTSSNELVLGPKYELIHQTGLDVQATKGNWLWKLEALHRSGQGDTFNGAVGGFEYTFVGILSSAVDLGVLGEYHYDDRGEKALIPFNNDVFIGARLAFNDAASSALLGGIVNDLDGRGKFLNMEFSRRIGDRWRIEAEARMFIDVARSDLFWSFDRDDYIQVELARFF